MNQQIDKSKLHIGKRVWIKSWIGLGNIVITGITPNGITADGAIFSFDLDWDEIDEIEYEWRSDE